MDESNGSGSLYERHEKRRDTIFFSQKELKDYLSDSTRIKDLLSCGCEDCSDSRNRFPALHTSNIKAEAWTTLYTNGPLLLALLVYLSKLHFIYPCMASRYHSSLRDAATYLQTSTELDSYFKPLGIERELFNEACKRALRMFEPVVLEFCTELDPKYRTYEPIDRFPFLNVKPLQGGSFGLLRRFEIYEEYCSSDIKKHMLENPGSTAGNASEKKLLFASKSVHKDDTGQSRQEGDILSMVSRIKKPASENIVTLLAYYSWRDYIYFVFPYVELDLYRQLNGPDPRHQLSNISIRDPLPDNWLWQQMVGVSEGLHTIHTKMENPFDGHKERVIMCHFDLKPANILITADKVLKITDFGQSFITLISEEDPIDAAHYRGDARYAPPSTPDRARTSKGKEPARSTRDEVTAILNYDVWSLACVMMEVLVSVFNLGDRTLDQFQGHIDNSPKRNSFYDNNQRLKSEVEEAIKDIQGKFQEQAPHHQYITDVAHLLHQMFHKDPYERISSQEVSQGLEAAKETYRKALSTQHSPLARKVLEYKPTGVLEEIGFDNGRGLTLSFAEMDDIQIEAIHQDNGTKSADHSDPKCRFRLWKRRNQRSFLLVYAMSGVGQIHFQDLTFPAWCFQPTYLFQRDKFDCVLFKHDERSRELAYIFTFSSRADICAFQGAFLQHKVLHEDHFSQVMEADLAFTKHIEFLGFRRLGQQKLIKVDNAGVQFWAKDSPRFLKSANGSRSKEKESQPRGSDVTTMAIFARKKHLKIFMKAMERDQVEAKHNDRLGHRYFDTYWSPMSKPWLPKPGDKEDSVFLSTPAIRPGQSHEGSKEKKKDKSEESGHIKMETMKIGIQEKYRRQLQLAAGEEYRKS
ncbi:hypothetical protein CDV36_014084 [Fusarium kuroshium]|uniref:Protein kinase domain-containing protein n=1 Tax=Fusarium kuroshium TaxID=2010991 RepID=A0A3M2RJ35_9HYPO|nr:hypothetical protein CDV36_014084 [Fusarium kuroshium]